MAFSLSLLSPLKNAFAGASPSQWVVAVNGDSIHSRTLANHFCQLRNIPSRNVIVLKSIPSRDQINVEEFRSLILSPLLQEIEARRLTPHIQGIAYSSDFPTAIALDLDLAEVKDRSQYLTPVGSINGLTFLYRFVVGKNPGYIGFDTNFYASHDGVALLNISAGTHETRNEILQWITDKKHEDAAKRLDEFASTAINPFPIEFLAAQQWSLAGNQENALRALAKSIQDGWRYRSVLERDESFAKLRDVPEFKELVNRCRKDDFRHTATRGFDARRFYAPNTLASNQPEQGVSYLLSIVLGVTRDRGINEPEAIQGLTTSRNADYSHPTGIFYFTKTGDVRTKARLPNFEVAIDRLKELGHTSKIVDADLPPFGSECSGVMIGVADFDWLKTGAQLLPGSIADNLTSYGGAMTSNQQTKLTEFIRHGAAASSGAVTEPYSIQNKFPHPMIQVHYANGLTCAESFYSSILCPYQLLIVGDPLCQPFADPPKFEIVGITDRQAIGATTQLEIKVADEEHTVDPVQLQWLVDGILKGEGRFDRNLKVLSESRDPGVQEWRFSAIGPKPIESKYEQSIWVSVGKAAATPSIVVNSEWEGEPNECTSITFQDLAPNQTYVVRHDLESIGKVDSNRASFELKPSDVGYGPIRLQLFPESNDLNVTAASFPVTIMLKRKPVSIR